METLTKAADQLTWEKLWLYMTLLVIIMLMMKASKVIDAYVERINAKTECMEAAAECDREEAKLARLRFDVEADAAAKANSL